MHDLGSTVCTQASLCGCTRLERANRLILHIAVYVFHCQLPNSKASRGAACSLSLHGKRTRKCMACLAQIAHRHRRLGALAPKA